jgi:hypothetical protein
MDLGIPIVDNILLNAVRLAAARTKEAVVALELEAGECGSGTQPGPALGVGTSPCRTAVQWKGTDFSVREPND